MPDSRNIHELKSLQWKLAYLWWFISNLTGQCQPFSQLVEKRVPFEQDKTCDNAFKSIKTYIMKLQCWLHLSQASHWSFILLLKMINTSIAYSREKKWQGKCTLLPKSNNDDKWSKLFANWEAMLCSHICYPKVKALFLNPYCLSDI